MDPIHLQVLEAARAAAAEDGTFLVADVISALPHLNAGTVRTHIASRCCLNAPSNHQTRYRYFRAVRRGVYVIAPRFRGARTTRRTKASQDLILASLPGGVDSTLVSESLRMTPTERLETMRASARSLDAMRIR